jgi:hypothetical protein
MANGESKGKKPVWPWVLLGCGVMGFLAIPVLAIVAAIAIPSLLAARRGSLETNAVGSMMTYCAAQTMFKRQDWDSDGELEYAKPYALLYSAAGPDGTPVMFIDQAFAAAAGAAGMPKHGYVFSEIETIGGQPVDWTTDFAFCALPADYGRTGYRTFIVKTDGTVYGMDQGPAGTFVTDYPADPWSEGWILAE